MAALISNLIFILFTLFATASVWQLSIASNLTKNPIACGGDFSYNATCPAGSHCKSLDEGELAGGMCAPWIADLLAIEIKAPPPKNGPEATPVEQTLPPDNSQPYPPPTTAPVDKTYRNTELGFEFQFPEKLIESEIVDEYSIDKQGVLIFCAGRIQGEAFCDEGIMINYGVPKGQNWGGGCEESEKVDVWVGEVQGKVCQIGNSYSYIRMRHPKGISELMVTANWGSRFSKEEAEKALRSFRLLE